MPGLRSSLNDLLAGTAPCARARAALMSPLPPLPAGPAARLHHGLTARRRHLVERSPSRGSALAGAVWALEPATAGGYGHGLLAVGRVL